MIDPPKGPRESGASDKPESEVGDKLSDALVCDLLGVLVIAIRNAVRHKPEVALDVLAWAFERYDPLVEIRAKTGGVAGAEALGIEDETQPRGHALRRPLAVAQAGGKRPRNAAIAETVARAISTPYSLAGAAGLFEIADAAGIDLRAVWTPGEALFSRLKVGQLEALHVELTGVAATATKKGALVEAVTALFSEAALRAAGWGGGGHVASPAAPGMPPAEIAAVLDLRGRLQACPVDAPTLEAVLSWIVTLKGEAA